MISFQALTVRLFWRTFLLKISEWIRCNNDSGSSIKINSSITTELLKTRVSRPSQTRFFFKSKFPTHSRGIFGLVWRIPKGFLIWTSFRGCTIGCPSQTCFFKNQNFKPIPVVFWGWFEGSLKDFWFGQVIGGAQGRQKSDYILIALKSFIKA